MSLRRCRQGTASGGQQEEIDCGNTADSDAAGVCDMSMDFASGKELHQLCREHGLTISAVMLRREMELGSVSEQSVRDRLARALQIMEASVHEPLGQPRRSLSGLIGGEAWKVYDAKIESLCGEALTRAIAYSLAVLEVNAAMGLIVAAPTAGSSGVLPGAVLSLSEIYGWPETKQMDGLLNAGAIGYLLMRNATVAGAEAGCQAEVGAASAMTASAIVELMGGTPDMCFQAASPAISNLLGLVCDPIAGLVEVPCQSRNAIGVANAFTCAQLALSGITHPVPFDEMVDAMYRVGRSLPWELRESAKGGNAGTPTGCRWSAGGCAGGCAGNCAPGNDAGQAEY